ncbi:MAG TPA: hypothetical protein VGB17_01145 [Pyrinomonadaceae bacterium]|jgi:hypothetical protein
MMKRWKKILLVLLGLLFLSQLPFIYRRYRLGQLHALIVRLNSARQLDQTAQAYDDYRGVIHVHSMLGGHSTGSFTEIIQAANANQLHFVLMTEHPSAEIDTAEMTLNGFHHGILFVNGSEISAANGDRLLLLPGDGKANSLGTATTEELISRAKAEGRLAFIAYPQEFKTWDAQGYDGIEVYNLYTNSKRASYPLLFFDGLWSYGSYPELLFTRFYERPDESLKLWDKLAATKNRRLVAIAGNDAHSNVGFSLGDETGKKLFGIKLDPYERSFRLVRTHALIEKGAPLSTQTLLKALASGHSYLSFDLFCESSGFVYAARNRSEQKIMGDEIGLEDGVLLTVRTPVPSRVRLFKDGAVVGEASLASSKEFPVAQKGIYRVEVYLDQLPDGLKDRPWIISNPIYVR